MTDAKLEALMDNLRSAISAGYEYGTGVAEHQTWCQRIHSAAIQAADAILDLQRDALRYRFINSDDGPWMDWPGAVHDATGVYPHSAAEADAAIDAALDRKIEQDGNEPPTQTAQS